MNKIQRSAVIMQSNMAWSCKHYFGDWGRIYKSFNPQKATHISPLLVSYGVSFVSIWRKLTVL